MTKYFTHGFDKKDVPAQSKKFSVLTDIFT